MPHEQIEEWRDIENHIGYYQISSLGRIKRNSARNLGKFISTKD